MKASLVFLACWVVSKAPAKGEQPTARNFNRDVQPLLKQYCYDCHGDGVKKGKVAFDELNATDPIPGTPGLWLAVLKNVRAGLMPPAKKPHPSPEERQRLEEWIKSEAFGLDPQNPDPGRVTVRRLNRVEYRNTIRDLVGFDFRTDEEFPPDDTGHGFDNIGDVLTVSPMLLEKYLAAARTIIEAAVPMVSRVPAEKTIAGKRFDREDASPGASEGAQSLSYYEAVRVTNTVPIVQAGRYELVLNLTATEKFVDNVFDYNRCRLVFRADGEELLRREYAREGDRTFRFEFDRTWPVGGHVLEFEVEPLTPGEKQVRSLAMRINSVTVRGPMEEAYWVPPKNYARIFPGETPADVSARRACAAELLGKFATKAFRRPVDTPTADRLARLAEGIYLQPGKTFEAGVAQAMMAVLASPRFLFREEEVEPIRDGHRYLNLDEYALASRLSYFLWSSMPDEELFRLAGERQLRANLTAQVKRMLADSRATALMQNFPGQWLQARDIESVPIDARAVLAREEAPDPEMEKKRDRFRELRSREENLSAEEKAELAKVRAEVFKSFGKVRVDLTGDLRRAMRKETEAYFEHIVRGDRSVLELIDSDYAFLNERLAKHYGLTNLNVVGDDLRLVTLPPGSPRGGVLTQGTVLAVTSNPTRTSPVKRGLFILDNFLGTPPPPPPPDIPPLEDAGKGITDHTPTLRETLELHRANALCSSCHNRMDPLGLAFENFNAMGLWREAERTQRVDVAGKLITGEAFTNVVELKRILATDRMDDFYRCFTEKMLIYALGRGLDYHDVETVDQIVARLEREQGRASALLLGIVESAPFQKRRNVDTTEKSGSGPTTGQRAELKIKP